MLAIFIGATSAHADETVKLGVMSGQEEDIWKVAQQVGHKEGLDIKLVPFTDYAVVNEALSDGSLDANAFQTKPYLDAQIQARGYKIVPIGYTLLTPIGLYSAKLKNIDQLKDGARIGLPNDPSNEARALSLLASHGLIELTKGSELNASLTDVTANPHNFKFFESDGAGLPRQLSDLDAAVINTNFAIDSGLDPVKDSLIREKVADNPYRNFIAVRAGEQDQERFRKLEKAYQNQQVADFMKKNYHGAVIPAW